MKQTDVPNHRQVFTNKNNVFVCRTQAGFKHALKKYIEDCRIHKTPVKGYPKTYPCLVIMHLGYCGYDYIQCNCIPMSKLRDIVEQDKLDSTNLLKLTTVSKYLE